MPITPQFLIDHFSSIVTVVIGLSIVWVGYRVIYLYRTAGGRIRHMNQAYELLIASLDEGRDPDLSSESSAAVQYLSELRAIIRDRGSERARYLKFKRKTVDVTREIADNLERCRTLTETLPLMGIFGTVLGFLISSGVFEGSFQATARGLSVALVTTLFALGFTIFIKTCYESNTVPLYFRLDNNLRALETYVERHGGIHHVADEPDPSPVIAKPVL